MNIENSLDIGIWPFLFLDTAHSEDLDGCRI